MPVTIVPRPVRLVNHCFTICTDRTSRVKPFTGRICSTVLDKDAQSLSFSNSWSRGNEFYRALISSSICVTSEQVPNDFRPRPLPLTPSCYLRQCTNPSIATILVPPFPVSSTCHSGSREKAFRLQPNEVGTFPNRNPSAEEEEINALVDAYFFCTTWHST